MLAPLFMVAGLNDRPGGATTVPRVDQATLELTAEQPVQLAAIMGWRQLLGVEAKRSLPEGPPATTEPAEESASPALSAGIGSAAHWPVLTGHSRLLLSNRPPTGPPGA